MPPDPPASDFGRRRISMAEARARLATPPVVQKPLWPLLLASFLAACAALSAAAAVILGGPMLGAPEKPVPELRSTL